LPTYQYACTECGHAFEQFQSFSDDALTVCPECEGRLRKVYNAVGVVFKGSGFYRTDSRTDGRSTAGAGAKGGEGSGSSEKSGSDGEKSTKTDAGTSTSDTGASKPAAATATKDSSAA
jgi:putative FmdB family regulatory protein